MADTIEALKHISAISRHLLLNDPDTVMMAVLLDMGFPSGRSGFNYLISSIVRYEANPTQMLTKEIYPEVGRSAKPRAKGNCVESAIGNVIDAAWESCNERVWACYFPVQRDGTIKRPTNGEFISQMAHFLGLWRSCRENIFGT